MPSAAAIDLDDIEDIVNNDSNIQRKSFKDVVLPRPRVTTFKMQDVAEEKDVILQDRY